MATKSEGDGRRLLARGPELFAEIDHAGSKTELGGSSGHVGANAAPLVLPLLGGSAAQFSRRATLVAPKIAERSS